MSIPGNPHLVVAHSQAAKLKYSTDHGKSLSDRDSYAGEHGHMQVLGVSRVSSGLMLMETVAPFRFAGLGTKKKLKDKRATRIDRCLAMTCLPSTHKSDVLRVSMTLF